MRIAHCTEMHFHPDFRTADRNTFALQSWVRLYETGSIIPKHLWNFPRSAKRIGDRRDLPYLKDVLKAGMDADAVLLTNDDTVLHRDILPALESRLSTAGAVCSFRITWNHATEHRPDFYRPAKTWVKSCPGDIGRDLFAFSKVWLASYWGDIPDFILGDADWDWPLALIIRKSLRLPLGDVCKLDVRSDLEMGYVWHADHERPWMRSENVNAKAKLWNRKLAWEWAKANDYKWSFG